MYVKMPFGLMNAGATFQRSMDIAFSEEIGYFIVIYLDNITIYSKTNEEHLAQEKSLKNEKNMVCL